MTPVTQALNPWLSIWFKPRATIRQILATDPHKHVIPLATLSGVIQTFETASRRHLGDHMPFIEVFLLCVVFGPLIGILGLYVSGAVMTWCGSKLGGQGTPQAVRTAIAWSTIIPSLAGGFLLILSLMLLGEKFFASTRPILDANPALSLVFLGVALLRMLIGLWGVVIFLHSIGEAHGFSVWRALGAAVFAIMLLLLLMLCIFGLIRPFI